MSDDEKPSPEELARRERWFEGYVRALETSVVSGPEEGRAVACPCCRYLTLASVVDSRSVPCASGKTTGRTTKTPQR
jgi:hypothetical protein